MRRDNTRYDGRFLVPTFDEVLELARTQSARRGRTIGVYPETKHPSYFDSLGLSLEEPLVGALRQHGLDRRTAPVFVPFAGEPTDVVGDAHFWRGDDPNTKGDARAEIQAFLDEGVDGLVGPRRHRQPWCR